MILGEIVRTRERAVGVGAGSTRSWSASFLVSPVFLPPAAWSRWPGATPAEVPQRG